MCFMQWGIQISSFKICASIHQIDDINLCWSVFSLQYSEKTLYNQLCFYRFIFDWDCAFAKLLQGDERSKNVHTHTCSLLLYYCSLVPNFQKCFPNCYGIMFQSFGQNKKVAFFLPSFYYSVVPPFGTEIKLLELLLKFKF